MVDTITGQVATAQLSIQRKGFKTALAPAITTYRPRQIHAWLAEKNPITIVVDRGALAKGKDTPEVPQADLNVQSITSWADKLKNQLAQQGIKAQVVHRDSIVIGHKVPIRGPVKWPDTVNAVQPKAHIEGKIILIGDPSAPGIMREIHNGSIAQRSLGKEHVGQGRAVIACCLLSAQDDSVILAASDSAGAEVAIKRLAALAREKPAGDRFYQAREQVRQAWAPTEVDAWKAKLGINTEVSAKPLVSGNEFAAKPGWNELSTLTGTAIVNISANEHGVVVGTKSWAKPVGLLGNDGQIKGFWGGDEEVTPRDIGLSADGKNVFAGYSLLGYAAAYNQDEGKPFRSPPLLRTHPIIPLAGSFKDTDRSLKVSPDHQTVLIAAGKEGIFAQDTVTQKELWRINTTEGTRARGSIHPEIAFFSAATL